MKNQKTTHKQSESKPLRASLYTYYSVPSLQDYADLMYQKKSEGNNQEVSFMSSLLNKTEAKLVSEYLENFLYNLGMDHELTSHTILQDFQLEQHEFEYDQDDYPDDFDPELYDL